MKSTTIAARIVAEFAAVTTGIVLFAACGGDSAVASSGTIGQPITRAAAADAATVFGELPEFSLTNQASETVTRADLLGHPHAIAAIFTSCSGPCPRITAGMRGLVDRLADTDVRFVSVSVDPATDTPEVLAGYAESYTIDTSRWTLLTGTEAGVAALLRDGLWMALERADGEVDPGERVTHSTSIVAVDRAGKIRGWYGGDEADGLAQLEARLRFLAAEE